MTTRPKVHRAELARAILSIAKRRADVDDPYRESLPDSPDADPREVLDYLQVHSNRGIPMAVLQADISDALTLNNWLWWEDRRRELFFLRAGVDRRLRLSQIGSQVGVGKQGVRDRIDRLSALLRFDRPDEKIEREARRTSSAAGASGESPESTWLAAHRDDLVKLIADMAAQAERYELTDDDREWLDELVADGEAGLVTPATMTILGLSVAELREAPAVLALPSGRPHHVHVVLARADALRSSFAGIGARS